MNEAKFSGCKFSTAMVPYMYGELPSSEAPAFESHLLVCSECTDEFAALSSARFEVYEWKKLEFDSLATPAFEIPYEREPVAATGLPWFDKVRAAFSQSWAVPGLAFAGLAVISMFAALLFPSSEKPLDVAADASTPTVVTEPAPAPTRSEAVPAAITPVAEKNTVNERPKIAAPLPTVAAKLSDRTTQKPAIRTDKASRPRAVESRDTSAKSLPVKAPTLNDPVEDEDTSLRLAELFDDVETSR